MSENFSHQLELFDPKHARPVLLIGAGSIGSYVALALAKLGVSDITVMDGDTVTSHNAPMSLYRGYDLGRRKVLRLQEVIETLAGVTITAIPEYYAGEPIRNTTVICCVDTMAARKLIWDQVKGQFTVDLFVDTRTAAAYSEVYAVAPRMPKECAEYEGSLFSDEEATRQTCGEHGIVYASMGVAAQVASIVSRFWQTGQKTFCLPYKHDIQQPVLL